MGRLAARSEAPLKDSKTFAANKIEDRKGKSQGKMLKMNKSGGERDPEIPSSKQAAEKGIRISHIMCLKKGRQP